MKFNGHRWQVVKVVATTKRVTVEMRAGVLTTIQDFYPWDQENSNNDDDFSSEQVKAITDKYPIGKVVEMISMDRESYDELLGYLNELYHYHIQETSRRRNLKQS